MYALLTHHVVPTIRGSSDRNSFHQLWGAAIWRKINVDRCFLDAV
jgi:hypothetical protein